MDIKNVFISFKSEEYDIAKQVVDVLEKNDITCWMASRELKNGLGYMTKVPEAISKCKAFVLILSDAAQTSAWIPKELGHALSHNKPVIPIVIDDCDVVESFDFLLTNVKKYNLSNDIQDELKGVADDIKRIINEIPDDESKDIKELFHKLNLYLGRKCMFYKSKIKSLLGHLVKLTPYRNMEKKSPTRLPFNIISLFCIYVFIFSFMRGMDGLDGKLISLVYALSVTIPFWILGALVSKLIVKIPDKVKIKLFTIATAIIFSIFAFLTITSLITLAFIKILNI